MGWWSNKIKSKDLKLGDHIYTWRRGRSYSHHGIYVGDEKVIHLTRGPGSDGYFVLSKSHQSEGPVLSSTLQDFLDDGELYCFEYGVSALYFLSKLCGTCTCASSDPPEHVLYRAYFLLTDGFGDYDLSNNNCEDFALYCKTELLDLRDSRKTGASGQIALLVGCVTTILAVTILPYGFLPTSPACLSLMFCYFICNFRLHFDAGSRVSYVLERVQVEEFQQLSSSEAKSSPHLHYVGAKWIPILVISALIVWYSTPENIILLCIRSFLLYIILSRLFFNYFRNHHFKISVFLFKNLLALMVCYWTPESTLLQEIRAYLLHGCFIVLVINPLINARSKLWKYIMDTIYLFSWWLWTPGTTIPQWFRLLQVNVGFGESVADLTNLRKKALLYILNFTSAFIIWYLTPETTILLWLRLLLLYGFYGFLIINPNFRWKLGNYVDDTICLFGLWYWTPGSKIRLWLGFCLMYVFFFYVINYCHLISDLNSLLFGLVTPISLRFLLFGIEL